MSTCMFHANMNGFGIPDAIKIIIGVFSKPKKLFKIYPIIVATTVDMSCYNMNVKSCSNMH